MYIIRVTCYINLMRADRPKLGRKCLLLEEASALRILLLRIVNGIAGVAHNLLLLDLVI